MANTMVVLTAKARNAGGKGEAKRLRRTGSVPAIAYGKGLPSTTLSVDPKGVAQILISEHGQNSVFELAVEGAKKMVAMIRDYSYHPIHRTLEHVDFVEVKLDKPVDVDIPLIGTGKPVGVTLGGVLRQVYRTIPVRCLPDRIPVKIEVDVTPLKLNEHIATQDLKLAEGLEVRLPAEQTLIAVVAPEKEREETPAPGAAPAAAAGATAPAAGAAKGAAPAAGAKAAEPAKDAKKK